MNRTNRTIGLVGWAMLACLLLAGVLVIAAVSAAGGIDGTVIQIDGEPMQFAELGIGHGLVALACIALTFVVLVLVVPLAVLIPLAIAAVALVGALLVAAGVMAMLFSPLILLGLAVWFAVRATRRSGPKNGAPAQAAGGATITG
jgi:hypothetical protein